MKTHTSGTRRTFSRLFWPTLVLLIAGSTAQAQSSTTTARTPGTPSGSYKLGDADAVNLFTGNLNYNLPLLQVGGRGEAQASLGIVIESQIHYREVPLAEPDGFLQHQYTAKFPDPLAFVGSVAFDYPSEVTNQGCGSGFYWTTFRPTMTFVEPDGTEHSLRDNNHHGNVITSCGPTGQSLGNVFQSTSGDFITFVNDTNMYTDCYGVSGCTNSVNGYLYFRNGTKSRVEGGRILWTQDRNGNKIVYGYETGPYSHRLLTVTDSLSRTVQIEYDVNLSAPYGRCTRLTYKGFGGTEDRVILIGREYDVSTLFRATQTWDSIRSPIETEDPNDSIVVGGGTTQAPDVIRAIWLPNGQSYQFKYNIFGQLARIDLPTGGAIEYDFADLFNIPFDPVPSELGPVTNQVSEKRVYGANGVLLSRTKFSNPSSYTSGVIPSNRGGVVRDVQLEDPAGNRLAKSRHYFYGAPSTNYGLLVPWWHGKEFRTETFDLDGTTILRVNENDWQQRIPSWCSSFPLCSADPGERSPTNHPFVVETRSTIVDGNLVSKASAVNPGDGSWAFDAYNNQTDSWVYGFGTGQPGALVKHTQTTYINTSANLSSSTGIYLLGLTDTTSVFAVNSSGQETLASSTNIDYDEYSSYPLFTYDAVTVTGWQDPGSVRGNPTTVKRWLNTDNSWIETHARFDQLGNSRESWDALGRKSETFYTDAFTDSVNRNTFAFPTLTKSPIPDSNNTYGSNSAFESSSVYDYRSGLVKTSTDITGQTTTFEYNDLLDRLTKVINPTGGGWTGFYYNDTVGDLYVKTTSTLDQNRTLVSYSFFDALGRSVRSFSPKGGGVWIIADTEYDAAGRVRRVSKPYEDTSLSATPNPADNWVTTDYDALGRVRHVITADGSTVETTYSGNTVTVIDADLNKRTTESDGLGRLTRTTEDPGGSGKLNYATDYTYDILGNLRSVDQGAQHRYFMYDSLSRLIRSYNPEQDVNPDLHLADPLTGREDWSTKIDYRANGDISSKTDARGIRTDFSYDNLNRVYQRSYTATRTLPGGTYTATPTVSIYYDGRGIGLSSIPASFLGKLTRVTSSVGETRYTEFDAMGRVKSSEQIVDGVTYSMPLYAFNLGGGLESQTYPSGRVVTNTYDDGGKLSVVSGQVPNQAAKTYASNFDYSLTSTGATSKVQLGNGRWESVVYNKRLQPTQIALGTTQGATDLMKLEYSYGTTNNNGNVRSQTITVPAHGSSTAFTAVQSYEYDSLNRLKSAAETSNSQASWQQTFDYDRWGNRSVVSATSGMVGDNPSISTSTNRITAQSGEYYDYDDAGNLTVDRVGNKYSFDGESRQAEFTYSGGSTPAAQYYYDGEGHRVKKVVGSNTTVFVYDAFGKLVAEYESNLQPSNGTTFLSADNLGTPRVTTDTSGNVSARHDYLPFGEEIGGNGGRASHDQYHADSVRQKYTGLQRDEENGLDYAQARYYASLAGRFTSVDPLMASASTLSPQTFNRYTYALNNPCKYTDPTGMAVDEEMEEYFAGNRAQSEEQDARAQAARDKAKADAKKKEQQQQQAQPPPTQPPPVDVPQGQYFAESSIDWENGPRPLLPGEMPVPTTLIPIEGPNQSYNGNSLVSPTGTVIDDQPNYGRGRVVDYLILDQGRNPMGPETGVTWMERVSSTNPVIQQMITNNVIHHSNGRPIRPEANGTVADTLGIISTNTQSSQNAATVPSFTIDQRITIQMPNANGRPQGVLGTRNTINVGPGGVNIQFGPTSVFPRQ
jgi:RHS repeat-associated protein